jgi:hypothetical protein
VILAMSDFESLLDMAGAPRPIEIIQYDTGAVLYEAVGESFGRVLHRALREKSRLPCIDCADRTIHRVASLTDAPEAAAPAGGHLPGAQFRGARLLDCWFHAMALRGACFHNAKLTGVCFSNADLRGADFTGARFAPSRGGIANSFRGADLDGAKFSRDADLSRAGLEGARNIEGVVILDADGSLCPGLCIDPGTGRIVELGNPTREDAE